MPGAFDTEDEELEPVVDPQGVLDGAPTNGVAHAVETPSPAAPAAPRRRRGRRVAGKPANVAPPPQRTPAAIARSQGLAPGEKPAPEPDDARDARNWWPRILKQEFIDQGFSIADARIYVERVKCIGRPNEPPMKMEPPIYGQQVAGDDVATAGEALVEWILQAHHADARGPATYRLKAYNGNPAVARSVGINGELTLESYTEIMQRRERVERMQRAGMGRGAPQSEVRMGPTTLFQPMNARPMLAAPVPVQASNVPAPLPPPPANASPLEQMQHKFMSEMWDEMMVAWREGRQPQMPQLPAAPPPPQQSAQEVAAATAKAVVDSLIAAGVIGAKPAVVAGPVVPQKDPLDAFYDDLATQQKRRKAIEGMARDFGMVKPEEIEQTPAEVPAPQALVDDDSKRQEGEGFWEHMMRRAGEEFSKNPGAAFEMFGKIMNSPLGGMIKDAILKTGAGLPSIPAPGGGGGIPGGGGFSPTT